MTLEFLTPEEFCGVISAARARLDYSRELNIGILAEDFQIFLEGARRAASIVTSDTDILAEQRKILTILGGSLVILAERGCRIIVQEPKI